MGKKFLSILTLLAICVSVATGANLPGLRMHRVVSAPQLRMKINITSFRGIPGGVAFPGVATPVNEEKITAIKYLPEQPDGQRLSLTVVDSRGQSHQVSPRIFDWQLGPIVNYVNDKEFDSLITYRGAGVERLNERLGYGLHFRYHPSVSGQLLGMRLWHGDFLLFSPGDASLDAARVDLPTDEVTADYILGAGEAKPNVAANRRRLAALQKAMTAAGKAPWDSYVITDKGRPVTYELENGKLALSGNPIWWFFSAKEDAEDEVVHHEKYSEAITAVIEEHGGINPQVYDALVTTMRYSALFRRIKADAPAGWEAFAKDVQDRKIGLSADTPTFIEVARPAP